MDVKAKPSPRGDLVVAKYEQIIREIPAASEVIYRCYVRSDAPFMLVNWYFFDNVIRDAGIVLSVTGRNLYIDDVGALESMAFEIWKYNDIINSLINNFNYPSQQGVFAFRQIRFDIKISNSDLNPYVDTIDNIIILKSTQSQSFTIDISEPV